MKEIASFIYHQYIQDACVPLVELGLSHCLMVLVFNNSDRFVLSNAPSVTKAAYVSTFLHDFEYARENDDARYDYYLYDRKPALPRTEAFKISDSIYPAYYIVRECPECTLLFSAMQNTPINDYQAVYYHTIQGFEEFCIEFIDKFIDIIKRHNVNYRYSMILNNPTLRREVIKKNNTSTHIELTDKEKYCLLLASQGYSSKRVATVLGISPYTVETHFKHIREKLQCSSLIEAVTKALYSGMIGSLITNHRASHGAVRPHASYTSQVSRTNIESLPTIAPLHLTLFTKIPKFGDIQLTSSSI